MADVSLLKVLVTDNIIVDVYLNTSNKKYCAINGEKYGQIYSYTERNLSIIEKELQSYAKDNKKDITYYKIIKNPYVETASDIVYGKTPYYLNDGTKIVIKWYNKSGVAFETKDINDDVVYKTVLIISPNNNLITNKNIYYLNTGGFNHYTSYNEYKFTNMSDEQVLDKIIIELRKAVVELNKISDYDLRLNEPSNSSDIKNQIKYYSPLDKLYDDEKEDKVDLSLDYDNIYDGIIINQDEVIPSFNVYIVNNYEEEIDNVYHLSHEYEEDPMNAEAEYVFVNDMSFTMSFDMPSSEMYIPDIDAVDFDMNGTVDLKGLPTLIQKLCHSDTAVKHGVPNNPSKEHLDNLNDLCEKIILRVKESINYNLTFNSGYRNPKVNALVGGAKNSQHCNGEAADLGTPNRAHNADLFYLIYKSNLPYDQLIWEYGDQTRPNWVHVSHKKRGNNRRQAIAIGVNKTFPKIS